MEDSFDSVQSTEETQAVENGDTQIQSCLDFLRKCTYLQDHSK